MQLRKHQKWLHKKTRKYLKKYNKVVVPAPTGWGKSINILHLAGHYLNKGERVLVIAPRRVLIRQLAETFAEFEPFMLMGADTTKGRDPKKAHLIVASAPTLSSRLKNDPAYVGDGIGLVIIDEVHQGWCIDRDAKNIVSRRIAENIKDAKYVGYTATPVNLGGWDYIIRNKYGIRWLIENGYLADFRYYAIDTGIDTSDLHVDAKSGDYVVAEMAELTNTPASIQAVMKYYDKHCTGKKTMIFCTNIEHAELLHEKFKTAMIVHSKMPEHKVKETLREFANSRDGIILNVSILTTGFDDPSVEALIFARPVKSASLYSQIAGRVLRGHNDIPVVDIIDLCNCYEDVGGLPDEIKFKSGKPKVKDKDEYDKLKEDLKDNFIIECPECKEEISLARCKRQKEIDEYMVETTWFCYECGAVCKVNTLDLQTPKKLKKLKGAADIDYSASYSMREVMQMLGEMIKANTRNAKTSWAPFVHKKCMKHDRKRYKGAVYGYAQKVYSSKRTWKMIMEIYGEN